MKIYLATPSRGALDYEHLQSVQEFIDYVRAEKSKAPEALIHGDVSQANRAAALEMSIHREYGGSLLDHVRSRMATDFYRGDFDVLLWIDDDMVFDAAECFALCQEAFNRQSLVGAVCSTRYPLGKITAKFDGSVEKIGFFSQGGIHECVSVGTGLTAVHRSVFERLVERGEVPECNIASGNDAVFPFYMTLIDDGHWWGEDTSFCIRARRVGFPLYVDTRARVGHKGSYVFHIEDVASSVTLHSGLTAVVTQPKAAE